MLVIRADGNSAIGLGHVMRCLSIADAVKRRGKDVLFVTVCEECTDMIVQRGHQLRLLEGDYQGDSYDMISELPQMENLCKELNTEITFLVDSYQVSEEYYQRLRELGKVACLEDMGQPYTVDMLINYNIYGEDYKGAYQIKAKNTLLGAAYMPLRAEFQEDMEYVLREDVCNVMITTGGADPYFASKAFADAFLQSEILAKRDIVYHVVSGPLNCFAQELKRHYSKNTSVVVYENVKSMKALMKQCDIVLTATGSTIYELSALGIPMICFYFAENQRRGAEAVERILGVTNAGDFSAEPSMVVQRAVDAVEKLVSDYVVREALSRKEKALVDGQGADRIAKALNEW